MSSSDYAEMIEIPVKSYEMVTVPKEKKRSAIGKLMDKINFKNQNSSKNSENDLNVQKEEKSFYKSINDDFSEENSENGAIDLQESSLVEEKVETVDGKESVFADVVSSTPSKNEINKKKKFSFDIISVQVGAIFVLAVAILLTNVFWKDSGINNLFKSVFAPTTATLDEREYTAFNAFSPSKADVEIQDGVITVNAPGAVYSPVDGKVKEIVEKDGKFTITVIHSEKYKTVISGADLSYVKVGEQVFSTAPVCYSKEGGVQVAMYDEDSLISTYQIKDGAVVWQS